MDILDIIAITQAAYIAAYNASKEQKEEQCGYYQASYIREVSV